MKKNLIIYVLLIAPIALLLAQPFEIDFTECNASITILAIIQVDGLPASSFDKIAAFDEAGNAVAVSDILEYGGQTFCNLEICEDDPATTDIDEGLIEGETFTFKLWIAAVDEISEHPVDVAPLIFTNAEPNSITLPGWEFSDETVLNFSSANVICTQTINLNLGWNLISLDVSPANKTLQSIFGDLQANNVEFITGYQNGGKIFNPNQPEFLSSLAEIENGFGYWIKLQNADVLTLEGTCLAEDFRTPLNAGWNLIAYTQEAPELPSSYFADLITNGDLEFVTGFENGVKTYNPDFGPAFFPQTLQQLKNGFGYWVKVVNASN